MPLKSAGGQMRVSKWKVVMSSTKKAFRKKHVTTMFTFFAAAAFVNSAQPRFRSSTPNHAWDDFYITYRHSKNQRHWERIGLHRWRQTSRVYFTARRSASSAVGRSDRKATLRIKPRALDLSPHVHPVSLGGAGAFLVAIAAIFPVRRARNRLPLSRSWRLTRDPRFTTNGMEAAFMLLFLSYVLGACLPPSRLNGCIWA